MWKYIIYSATNSRNVYTWNSIFKIIIEEREKTTTRKVLYTCSVIDFLCTKYGVHAKSAHRYKHAQKTDRKV